MVGSRAVPAQPFVDALNEQIAEEFAASQQYAAVAIHYDAETLPRLAAFFYRQAVEERNHAMMMIRYLLDAGVEPVVPGVESPQGRFADIVAPVALALEQEQRVTEQVSRLAAIAREAGDYASEQFMGWFIREQVEEVASMNDLLTVVRRALQDPKRAEEVPGRQGRGDVAEPPGAPTAAGGAL